MKMKEKELTVSSLMKNLQNKANIVRVSKIIRNFLFAGLVLWIIGIPAVLFPAAVSLWSRLGVTPGSRYSQCGLSLLMVFYLTVNLKLFRFFDRLKTDICSTPKPLSI